MNITQLSDISVDNGTEYYLQNDVEITDEFSSIETFTDLVFDGNGYTIYYSNSAEWPGLFKIKPGVTNITLKNVNVVLQSSDDFYSGSTDYSSLVERAGGIASSDEDGSSGAEVSIEKCSFIGNIGKWCGGIYGSFAGNQGSCTIKNCYTQGYFSGNYAGGIIGPSSGRNNTWDYLDTPGSCSVYGCYSNIFALNSDVEGCCGISGGGMAYTTISSCFSLGDINRQYSSGISGYDMHESSIHDCYSVGNITGKDASGIIEGVSNGDLSVDNSVGLIYNCYALGSIKGTDSGGMQSTTPLTALSIFPSTISKDPETNAYQDDEYHGETRITDSTVWDNDMLNYINSNDAWSEADGGPFLLKAFMSDPWCEYTSHDSPPIFCHDTVVQATASTPTVTQQTVSTPTVTQQTVSTPTVTQQTVQQQTASTPIISSVSSATVSASKDSKLAVSSSSTYSSSQTDDSVSSESSISSIALIGGIVGGVVLMFILILFFALKK